MTSRQRQSISNKLAGMTNPAPALQDFLDRAGELGPEVADALEGIWCGRSGRVTAAFDGGDHALVVGWYEGRVEYAYIS